MNELRTYQNLNTPDSSASVAIVGEQLNIGSINAHEIAAMLKQSGEVLVHSFKRLNAEKQVVVKSYKFDRYHVESFAAKHCSGYALSGLANEEMIKLLRSA